MRSSSSQSKPEPDAAKPSPTSAEGFLANGSEQFHAMLATHLETSTGKAMPQVEIRFKDLSLAAKVTVANKDNELPTLFNHAKKSVMGFSKSSKRVVHKDILHTVSGVFKPATMTLLLGQPGSGKSSLMKMLAGRFPIEKNIQFGGDIQYNGSDRSEVLAQLPQLVAYMSQRDHHYPTLTVQETMEFAHQACGGSVVPERVLESMKHGTPEENSEALETLKALYEVYPDVVVRQLGLSICKDTIVGSAMLRGVSGGERKRVTIGEMEFGMKQVSLMDEISTGLDSAATFDIIKSQRSLAKYLKKTIVIALLQPSPEVFDLFDDVLVMNQGHVMYHGPCNQALAYFESLGFVCPPKRDVADFLLDLGTPQQLQYVSPLAAGSSVALPRYPGEYSALFQLSPMYRDMMDHVDGPVHPLLLQDADHHMKAVPEFQNEFAKSTIQLVSRQMKVMLRNTAFVKTRAFMVVVMGLLYATTFYQVDPQLAQVMYGVIFQALLFLALGQVALLPAILDAREIFYKQRGAHFFRTLSFVLAQTITQVPFSVAEAVIFGTIIYWISGFVSDVGAFLVYELILLLTNILFASWFFFVAVASPDLHVAKPLSLVSVLLFVLFAGFIIVKTDIPDYFIWIYWINPISWGMRALSVNQYMASEFQVCEYNGVDYCKAYGGKTMGEVQLELFGMPTGTAWIGYCLAYMVAMYFAFVGMSFVALEYCRYEHGHGHGPSVASSPEDSSSSSLSHDHEPDKAEAYAQMPSTPVLGSHSDDSSVAVDIRGPTSVAAFIPVTLAFQNLHYFVPNPTKGEPDLELLKGVSGYALPGTVTALMGSSGAGKTTLMDVIAGRKTGGKIVGDILLNGYAASDLAIRRCTGYCEQMDIHCESATFREALTFSAMLRQSSDVPTPVKMAHVEECIRVLELHNVADAIVRGSSVEQMKRLTIGVELAAAPSVLFLDEPTSGLDARSAKIVMTGIRKIASTGRTVVCTIHQPSAEVFDMFDYLLLLKRGGETVYYGDLGANSEHLIEYFTRVEGTSPLQPGANPATWMLDVIGAGVEAKSAATDFVQVFHASPEAKQLQAGLAVHMLSHPDRPEMKFTSKRAASNATQCQYVVQRFMRMYWRTPSYNYTRLMLSIFLAVLFGLCFRSVDYTTFSGVNGGIGMVFITTLFVGIISFNSVLPLAAEERASYYRERASQTYNALWYFVGSTVAEIPYVVVTSFVFTIIYYPFVGFKGSVWDVVFYGINLSLFVLYNVYFGQFMAYVMPRVDVAAAMGVLVNSIFFLFMGYNPPASQIPSGYRWLTTICPPKYSLSVLVAQVFSKCQVPTDMGCQIMTQVPPIVLKEIGQPHVNVKQFTEHLFDMKYDDALVNTIVVVGCIVVFRVLGLLALRYVNHQKR
ncbi:hypothetical protein DYB37_011229 [Aphanomyces astaci]|uniref:ABC transporter domain-containing protein n=1 Tax=Aphanomyces astaci TaxID=112090 RepID=A0A3R6ZYL0_APHAT|nr:hypothetical protein DYB35_011971 [Aphanomyces astaci]RHZ03372.1 hypothetical protein DYB37_011229 [Aphanomyces astaci]